MSRQHREARPVPSACPDEAETTGIERHQDDEQTSHELHYGSWL